MDGSKRNASDAAIKGWTKEDKFVLFDALRFYGSCDIANIMKCTEKTEEEVVKALNYYKRKAFKNMPLGRDSSGTQKTKNVNIPNQHIPLVSWAKKMMESLNVTDLKTETSTALRMIAEFENLPDPKDTYNINFKDVYLIMADAIDGKSLRDYKAAKILLDKCIIDTALSCKTFLDHSLVAQALSDNKSCGNVQNRSSNIELTVLRQLLSQEAYNPLQISEEHLKAKNAI